MAETFDPAWMVLFIVRIVLVIATVFFMSFLILSVVITLEDDELNRFAYEMGEVVSNSELTYSKGVFSEEKLDRFMETLAAGLQAYDFSGQPEALKKILIMYDDSPNIEPEFARHCSFAYAVQIKVSGKEWVFGYHPAGSDEFILNPEEVKTATESFPVSVRRNGAVEPAEMTINTFLTPLTRYSCIAENARKYKEKQELGLPACEGVCRIAIRNFGDGDDHICRFSILQPSIGEYTYISCRHLQDTKIFPSYITYSGRAKLVAYPLKQASLQDPLNDMANADMISKDNCRNLGDAVLQKTDAEDVDSVIFCVEPR